jgi:polar amino acid transport system substrate-binding protein
VLYLSCRRYILPFLFMCALLVVAGAACAEQAILRVAFGIDRAPYVFEENGVSYGMEHDVVKEVLAAMGYKMEVVYAPVKQIKAGSVLDVDAIAGVSRFVAEREREGYYYSAPHVEYENVAVVKRTSGIKIASFADIRPYKLGMWRLAQRELGDEFFELTQYLRVRGRYHEYTNQRDQVSALMQGYADVIILDRSLFKFYAGELDYTEPVLLFPLFENKNFARVQFQDQQIRDEFDHVLSLMRKDGRYEAIVETYANGDFRTGQERKAPQGNIDVAPAP